jgi:hypothetical protein
MHFFDFTKARAHRRHEAEAGFPLLRACPNTPAIARIAYLDSLQPDEQIALADQLSDLYEAQSGLGMQVDERSAFLQQRPLVAGYLGEGDGQHRKRHIHSVPVKVLAGVMKDTQIGGVDGWANSIGLSHEARRLPVAHAQSLDEIVPIAPRRLRKLIGERMTERFGATPSRVSSEHTRYSAIETGCRLEVDVIFARSGGGSIHQFHYLLKAEMAGRAPVMFLSYEGVWLTPSRWDYVTETNAERSIAHFAQLIETCVQLI